MGQDHAGEKVLFAEERKRTLVEYINNVGRVTVPELCQNFDVSSATIRNDLRDLDESGLITRTHGGAIKKSHTGHEPINDSKVAKNTKNKASAAKVALDCIDDGDTIILDTGTTTFELAKLLGSKKNITVVTNDLNIAAILERMESVDTLLIGGLLRKGFHCTIDHGSSPLLESLSVDKAMMGANAFSIEKGASTPDLSQAALKKQMIRIASKVIIICDHTKLEMNSFMNFAAPNEIDMLITDTISDKLREQYAEADIEILTFN